MILNPQQGQEARNDLISFFKSIGNLISNSPLVQNAKQAFSDLTGFQENGNQYLEKIWKGLSGEASAQATLEANKMNIENQNYWNRINMQREDTAHQREVADLQAAGLNPWLAMGNGAQSTAMNTATVDPVDGSKILSATTGMALVALIKLLAKKV